MSISPETAGRTGSLQQYTLPLAALLGLALALHLPDNPRLDNALNLAFPAALDPRIVVVGIDDASLRDYGRLEQWPRALYAQALHNLNEAGARVIGLDVLLSDPAPADHALRTALNQPNLVRSLTPEDYFAGHHRPTSPGGVSVLNAPRAQGVSEVQTAYAAGNSGTLLPSFAAQVARGAGQTLRADTTPHLIGYVPVEQLLQKTVSFRDVVNGNIRFGDFQNRAVLIGETASGLGNILLPDIDGRSVPGVLLQARAVSALLTPPFQRFPLWLTACLCVLIGGVVVTMRGYWGFVIAAAVLMLCAVGWHFRLVIPGVTLSLAAILSSALVAFEQWWLARRLSLRDPLTGVGNRLALSRTLEKRWPARASQPITVLVADINELRRINEQYGRLGGERALRELAQRLERAAGRKDTTYRWGPEEFAVVIPTGQTQDIMALTEKYQRACADFRYADISLHVNLGSATTAPTILTPGDLLEAASRQRYRLKYEREREQ